VEQKWPFSAEHIFASKYGSETRLSDFYWYNIPKREKHWETKWSQNIPNGCKIDQMAKKCIYHQHLPLQDSPKFTQIGISGLKIYHLATLAGNHCA
jgi:hypothetical protein